MTTVRPGDKTQPTKAELVSLLNDARALCGSKCASKEDHARGLELMARWRELSGYNDRNQERGL